eukprot:TRINITY_DN6394_c0_g1_i2.p1 TRINITY_DN6394_c0_g1~~TRINITY_DN6394_c0_g1_i2.p1  ORF type:complete len:232 (-),score=19.86 TRINITY_DN6394_c0_g1_i2:705-1400(-)
MDLGGVVVVTVLGARGLPKSKRNGFNDYYCVVTLKSKLKNMKTREKKTEAHANTYVVWNEKFTIEYDWDSKDVILRVAVCYKKRKRIVVGAVEIPLEEVPSSQEIDQWHPLFMSRKYDHSGLLSQIHLMYSYRELQESLRDKKDLVVLNEYEAKHMKKKKKFRGRLHVTQGFVLFTYSKNFKPLKIRSISIEKAVANSRQITIHTRTKIPKMLSRISILLLNLCDQNSLRG